MGAQMNERDKELLKQADDYADSLELGGSEWCDAQIKVFASLIRADEREACAKVCEEVGEHPSLTPRHCVDAIRARGNT